MPHSHLPAWCVGGLVSFVINVTHLRIKPLALASGHSRYTTHNRYTRTEACVRWGMAVTHNRYKFVTVSLPRNAHAPCNGRFTSETAPEVV